MLSVYEPLLTCLCVPLFASFSVLSFLRSRWEGTVGAGSSIELIARLRLPSTGVVDDELCVETDLVGRRAFCKVVVSDYTSCVCHLN